MFKLQRTPSYWWPVKIDVRAEDGKYEQHELELKYARLDVPAFESLMAEVRSQKLTDQQVCSRIVLDWRKVVDDDGSAVLFSHDALTRACQASRVAAAIVRTYIEDYDAAGLGNS